MDALLQDRTHRAVENIDGDAWKFLTCVVFEALLGYDRRRLFGFVGVRELEFLVAQPLSSFLAPFLGLSMADILRIVRQQRA